MNPPLTPPKRGTAPRQAARAFLHWLRLRWLEIYPWYHC